MFVMMWVKIVVFCVICIVMVVVVDLVEYVEDEEECVVVKCCEELLMLVVKVWLIDIGVEVVFMGIQIYGGMGFIEEIGVVQYLCDVCIVLIYEGINVIQVFDLVGCKFLMVGGVVFEEFYVDIEQMIEFCLILFYFDLLLLVECLEDGLDVFKEVVVWFNMFDLVDCLFGVMFFLIFVGEVIGGWMLCVVVVVVCCCQKENIGDLKFVVECIVLVNFYVEVVLVLLLLCVDDIMIGYDMILELGFEVG